jgi:hypothetical protein
MLVYELICENGHTFEAWFPSFEAFQAQNEAGIVSCAICGDASVNILPSGRHLAGKRDDAAVSAKTDAKRPSDYVSFIKCLNHFIRQSGEDVGERFSQEAKKIFYGEAEHRNIYGTATDMERSELNEEGIPYLAVPKLPEEVDN